MVRSSIVVGVVGTVASAAMGCVGASTPAAPDAGAAGEVDAGALPDATPPDAGTEAGAACAPSTGTGTTHPSSIATAETWTAADSPHIVGSDTSISAKITLEACAVVKIAAGATVTFGAGGSLVANGTATEPVTIDAVDATKPWSSIRFIGGTGHLSYTTIDHGGDPLNTLPYYAASLDVRADELNPAPVLFVDHVTVKDSASQGLYVHNGALFDPASSALTVRDSAGAPMHVWTIALDSIPDGDYTENATGAITISAEGCGNESLWKGDGTIHERGVPYVVGYPTSDGVMCVGASAQGAVSTLTIEPGVTLRFMKNAVLHITAAQGTDPAGGALIANGTVAKPIVFTSAATTPAPGDWLGIWFGDIPDPRSTIDHAIVQYAGGMSSSGSGSCQYTDGVGTPNDAAIRILGAPSAGFVTNTTIADSAAHGIDRGYRSDTKVDFLATNTFTNIAKCKQTYPSDANGACPAPAMVPCP